MPPTTPVLLDTFTTNTSQQSWEISNVPAPDSGGLFFVTVSTVRGSGSYSISGVTADMGTVGEFVEVVQANNTISNPAVLGVFRANAGASPASGSLTVTMSVSGVVVWVVHVWQVASGFDIETPIRQVATTVNGTSSSLTVTLPDEPLADSLVVGAVRSRNGEADAPTDYTQLANTTFAGTVTNQQRVDYANGDAPDAIEWADLGILTNAGLLFEIVAAPETGEVVEPESITSEEALGEPTITFSRMILSVGGIDSEEAFGIPDIFRHLAFVSATSIPSEGAFGTANVLSGALILAPSAIEGAEAFGDVELLVAIPEHFLGPGGIAGLEEFGETTLVVGETRVFPVGIVSAERFGVGFANDGLFVGKKLSILVGDRLVRLNVIGG